MFQRFVFAGYFHVSHPNEDNLHILQSDLINKHVPAEHGVVAVMCGKFEPVVAQVT